MPDKVRDEKLSEDELEKVVGGVEQMPEGPLSMNGEKSPMNNLIDGPECPDIWIEI